MCKTFLVNIQLEVTAESEVQNESVKEFVENMVERAQVSDDFFVSIDSANVLFLYED